MATTIVLVITIAAIVAIFVGIIYTFMQKPSVLQNDIFMLELAALLMLVGYLVEIMAQTEEGALLGAGVAYIGKPYTMVASLYFIWTYCGYKVPVKFKIALACFAAIFPALVFTNRFHHLYYSTVVFDRSAAFSPLTLGHGPLYYLYMILIFTVTIIDLVIAVREFMRCNTKAEKESILWIFAMIGFGIMGYVVYLIGNTQGYDFTMAGVVAGAAVLFWLFFRYRIFDVVSVAKETALQHAATGLLIMDKHNDVVYVNNLAVKTWGERPSPELFRNLPAESTFRSGDRIYTIQKMTLDERGYPIGTMVELTDVTDSTTYAARLETDVEARTKQIKSIQRAVIGGIANVVEARNGETGVHIVRTGQIVQLLAKQLKKMGTYPDVLTDSYIRILVDAAPLHDIGKITISDAILMKPGKLTPEEFDVMKQHSAAGVGIIHKILDGVESREYVVMAERVAHYHHEKWDGSGYPCGLAGEGIPLCARIMAVADVYDALRSERCYKKAFDKETSRKIILEGSGSHFDPKVVEAFEACIDQIETL